MTADSFLRKRRSCSVLLQGILAGVFLSVALRAGPFPFFEPEEPVRAVEVVAHRGASRQAPENTRPALVRCIEDGFEWAEVDVRLTRDRTHVLAHGASITGSRGETREVSESTLAELKQLDLGTVFAARYAGERILSLDECLALAKGKINLYLDCKSIDPIQLVREIIDAGMERQVVIYGSLAQLSTVRALAGDRLALMSKWHPASSIQPWIASNHLAAVEMDAEDVTREAVRDFHAMGVKVEVKVLDQWDQAAFWDRAVAAGADWLQTDLPEEIVAHELWQKISKRPVLFSLHRGANRYAPENTLPAFEKAIRLGADFVEFDVRTTSDGRFYLLHDSNLEGKTSGHGPIAEAPSEIIDHLSAGEKLGHPFAAVHLPTLDQFLDSVAGRVNLYFDAKAIPPEALAAAVERHQMADRTVVYQSVAYLQRLKAIDPRIRSLPPLGGPDQLPHIAAALSPYALDVRWDILSRELIARCHALGIRVFSDALGEHETVKDYLEAIDWGIDVIQTDHPMRLLRAMELWQRQTPPHEDRRDPMGLPTRPLTPDTPSAAGINQQFLPHR